MNRAVLDASTLLALLFDEPGADVVAEALTSGSLMTTVNLSDVLTKLEDRGISVDPAISDLTRYGILDASKVVDFAFLLAEEAARLRARTRDMGLSLGDRACLALARTLGMPPVTADSSWAEVAGVSISLIR